MEIVRGKLHQSFSLGKAITLGKSTLGKSTLGKSTLGKSALGKSTLGKSAEAWAKVESPFFLFPLSFLCFPTIR